MAVARGAHRDWASRGLFTGVAMVSGLVCSNGLLGRAGRNGLKKESQIFSQKIRFPI